MALSVESVALSRWTAQVANSEVCRLVPDVGRMCENRKLQLNVGKRKIMSCSRNTNVSDISVRPHEELMR